MSLLNTNKNTAVVQTGHYVTTTPTFITTKFLVPAVDIDTGINDNYFAQKQVTERLHYRMLDKWLYDDELAFVLKFLTINNGKVNVVKNMNEYKNNDIGKDSVSDVESKADYIEENILTLSAMRRLLIKIVQELGHKWYDLPHKEMLVVNVVGKYIKKKFKQQILD